MTPKKPKPCKVIISDGKTKVRLLYSQQAVRDLIRVMAGRQAPPVSWILEAPCDTCGKPGHRDGACRKKAKP